VLSRGDTDALGSKSRGGAAFCSGVAARRYRDARGHGGDVVTEYACDYCGDQGTAPLQVDMIRCPVCGEPVTLVAEHLADEDDD